MKHFSHPHALKLSETLVKNEEDEEEEIIMCSGCEQPLSSAPPNYACPKPDCDFFLHKSCLELPEILQHKSHRDHKLSLISEPPQYSLYYDCNACGGLINGFSFYCHDCDFRLDVKCAFLPETVVCKAHPQHALCVRHYTPKPTKDDDGFQSHVLACDVCDGCATEGYWSYYCKHCDFTAHLECAFKADYVQEEDDEDEEEKEEEDDEDEEEKEEEDEDEEEKEEDDEDEEEEGGEMSDAMKLHVANIKAMDQMAKLQFQMKMAQLNATTVANLFRTNV